MNFSGAQINNLVVFDETSFIGTNFDNSLLNFKVVRYTEFSNASFRNANVNIWGVWGHGGECDFSFADFSGATITNLCTNYYKLMFTYASFRNAKLTNIDFKNADLTGADFTGAILKNVSFKSAIIDEAIGIP